MSQIPIDTSCEAEYEDGYVHSETELGDASPYDEKRNVFYDILEAHPSAEHGRMVRFSVFWDNMRYDLDWRGLPDNARPIRFRDGFCTTDSSGQIIESGFVGVHFGYQYNDESGRNVKEIYGLPEGQVPHSEEVAKELYG